MKIGPVVVEISERAGESYYLSADSLNFEYTQKCWNEQKAFVDRILGEELIKSQSNIAQKAKTELGMEIVNALTKHALQEDLLTNELVKTGKFSKEEAGIFLKEAISQGILYHGNDGFYVRN